MVRQRADIRDCRAHIVRQLALNSSVELVDQRPLVVSRNGLDAGCGQETRSCWTVGVGERISIGEGGSIPIGITKRCDRVECLPNGERLCIRRLVPLVAADAAKEKTSTGAHSRLAVAKRVPRDANTRRDMMILIWSDTARHSRVSGEQHS